MDPGKLRRFLYAMDSDKKKTNSGLSSGLPVAAQSLGQVASVPKLQSPSQQNTIPAIPGLKKLPKFGKIKNSLKSQFKPLK